MRKFLGLLLFCSALFLSGGESNAIRNADFKLGHAGFGLWRLLRPEVNPDLEYIPLSVENKKLVLDNSRGEYFQIRSAEFSLPENRKITFSTSFQAPEGVLDFTVLHITGEGKWITHHRTVPTTGKQQKFEFSFQTGQHGGAYMLVVYSSAEETPKGIFRFDYFRIAGGENAPEIIAGCFVEKTLYLLEEEKVAKLRFMLSSSAPEKRSGKLELTVRDPRRGALLFQKEEDVDLGSAPMVREIAVPLTRSGMFVTSARWNGKEIPVLNGVFSVIRKYSGKPFIDPAREFAVGVNGGLGYIEQRGKSRGGFEANGISPLKKYELLQKMGCRLIRDWDSGIQATDWRCMEPENGKFDFKNFDFSVDTARRYGMQILPVFGRMYENWQPSQREFRPEWLREKLIRIEKNPPGTHPKFIVRVPPMPLWERYIAAFAKHAGKRISIYEIMNEPDLNMSPELYLRYMIPAAAVLKKHAPHATVIGICATGDKGNQVLGYLQECVRLGAAKHLDGISFHPYNARTLNSLMPADRQIGIIRNMVGTKPLYNSELYYLFDVDHPSNSAGQILPQARHAAWRFLTDLGEGLTQSCATHMRSLWNQPLHPTCAAYYQTDSIPNDVFVAYNTLARLFEGAKAVKKIRLPHHTICYVYRKNGKPIAALWNSAEKKGLFADLSPFQVTDLFGNPEKAGKTPLSGDPFYLTPNGQSEAEFLSALENLTLTLRQPVSGAPLARCLGNSFFVMLHNESDQEQSGVIGITGGGWTAVHPVRFRLAARESRSFEIPVRTVKPKGTGTELILHWNGTTFRTPIKVVQNKQLEKTFQMENAEGKLEFGNDGITLEMRVKDSTDAGATGTRPLWKTDCVELFFDTAPLDLPLIRPQAYTKNTFRLFITPRDSVKLHSGGPVRAEDCRLELQQDSTGYSFKLTIPVKTASLLGFDVKIDDAGPAFRETTLSGRRDLFRNRTLFCIAGKENVQ